MAYGGFIMNYKEILAKKKLERQQVSRISLDKSLIRHVCDSSPKSVPIYIDKSVKKDLIKENNKIR